MDSDKPNIRAVRADKDRRLVIRWRGGAESVVDVSQHIAEYAIFVPLRSDHDAFRKAKSVSGAGACIGRTIRRFPLTPSGVSPLNREQRGYGWRTAHQMTQAEAANTLGVPSYVAVLRSRLSPPAEDCQTSRLRF